MQLWSHYWQHNCISTLVCYRWKSLKAIVQEWGKAPAGQNCNEIWHDGSFTWHWVFPKHQRQTQKLPLRNNEQSWWLYFLLPRKSRALWHSTDGGEKKEQNILETEEKRIEQDGESDTSAGDEVEAEMKAWGQRQMARGHVWCCLRDSPLRRPNTDG